jgi:hypothetical protein
VRDLIREAYRVVPVVTALLWTTGCADGALKETSLGSITDVVSAVSTIDGSVTGTLQAGMHRRPMAADPR